MKNVKLNQEQQSALEQIKQGGNYIILGNAGTGKSTLLRHLHDVESVLKLRHLKRRN